jgi:hypothetical protein
MKSFYKISKNGLSGRLAALFAILSLAACALPAKAQLTIIPYYDSSITSDPNAATIENTIQTSIDNLEVNIANPVTITVDFQQANTSLADSSTALYATTYSSYLSALETHQTLSTADTIALSSLGLTAPYTSPNPTTSPVNNITGVDLRTPLAYALGLDPTGQTNRNALTPGGCAGFLEGADAPGLRSG